MPLPAIVTACLLCSSLDAASLITNGGNDEALVGGETTGWTEVEGVAWTQRSANPNPQAGMAYFFPSNGGGANNTARTDELAQIVDVTAFATSIDAGTQQFDFSGYVSGYRSGADSAQIIIEFEDESGVVLDTYNSGAASYNYQDTGWTPLADSLIAPVGTRQIQIRLIAQRVSGGGNDGYFDSLVLSAVSPGILDTTEITFNGISGSNNDAVASNFGSNLSSNIPGATVIGAGTPGIALTWASVWELHGSLNSFWSALDAAGSSSSTPTIGQLEAGSSPSYIDFTVADGSQLVLNSVDLGMASDKPDTCNFTITIAEVGGAVVATYTPPAMDGDGSSGVMAQTVNLNFTGDFGVDYRLQFEDVPDTNGGAIDNLNFSEIVAVDTTPPVFTASDALSPAAGSTDVALMPELVLTFGESIALGTGNIVIRRLGDDSVVDTMDLTGRNVLVDGAQVKITPSTALAELSEFYIEIDAGAFVDFSGNSFAGIGGAGVWYFTTIETLRLHIAKDGSNLNLWWKGTPNKVYNLLSSSDRLIPLDSWASYDPDGVGGNQAFENISFSGAITTLDAVPVIDSSRFFALEEKQAPVLVAAHRGDSVNAPENTIASITSIAGTADLSEMDVQVTSDGVLVLMHDNTIDRTTDSTGTVASMTLSTVQALDAGVWFSSEFTGEQVPTMAAAINAAITSGIEPLIERKKGAAADYHAEFASLALSPNDFRVISFDAAFLAALNAHNSDYRLGLLGSSVITQAVIDQAKADGADFLSWKHSRVDQSVVDLVYANGLELMVWTVNDAGRMQELIDFGVGGITTDNPTLLRTLLPDSGSNGGSTGSRYFSEIVDVDATKTVIDFNGISGSNNGAVPSNFGSNLSSNIPGATVIGAGTPGIALTWASVWELHFSEKASGRLQVPVSLIR